MNESIMIKQCVSAAFFTDLPKTQRKQNESFGGSGIIQIKLQQKCMAPSDEGAVILPNLGNMTGGEIHAKASKIHE